MRMYTVYIKDLRAIYVPAEDAEKVYSKELDKWSLRFYRNKELIAEFFVDDLEGWVEKLPEQGGDGIVAC